MVTGRRTFTLTAALQRTIRFVAALALLTYEAVWYEGDTVRWHLILLYGTMMGLPVAEWGDAVRRQTMADPKPEEPPDVAPEHTG